MDVSEMICIVYGCNNEVPPYYGHYGEVVEEKVCFSCQAQIREFLDGEMFRKAGNAGRGDVE